MSSEAIEYEEYFIEGGKVGLIVKYAESSRNEYLLFKNLEDIESCALARPHIPQSMLETIFAMMEETMAHHGVGHFA
jgi:hypothetical protein